MICKCPNAASLPGIPGFDCPEDFGQIQKVAFQRLYKSTGERNGFPMSEPNTDGIESLAAWQVFLDATDDSKIVVSPYIQNPETTPGGPRTFGGGNETLGGVEDIIGSEPTAFTGVIRKAPQHVIKAIKQIGCEAVGVYLFDEHGNIASVANSPGERNPIPIRSFFVGDKSFGGFDAPDSNIIQWNFLPNYSDDLIMTHPDGFNPLNDLRPEFPVTFRSFEALVAAADAMYLAIEMDEELETGINDLGATAEMNDLRSRTSRINAQLTTNGVYHGHTLAEVQAMYNAFWGKVRHLFD